MPSSPFHEEQAPQQRAVSGVGEMAELTRTHDWSRSPLGPIEAWPEGLLCSVNTMLACQFPSVILWGPEMVQFYNDSYRPLMAEKHPTALGQTARECWKEAWHLIGPQWEAVQTRGETFFMEEVLVPVLRNGALDDVYWTYSYSPIYGATGTIDGILIVCQDMTEKIRATRERDEASRRLQQVFDLTTDGILSIDRSWRCIYANPRARQIVAASGEFVGKNIWEAFPAMIYEDSPYVKFYRQAMDEGIAGEFEAFYPAPLNIWVRVQVRPSAEGLVTYFRDVTEEKQTTSALHDSGIRFNAIYSTSHEYIGVLSREGTILDCNRAALEFGGNTLAEVVGRPFWEGPWFVHTPGAPEMARQVIAAGAEGKTVRREMSLVRPNGETMIFDFSLSPFRDEQGEVVFLVPEARDITELKRAEAALLQSEKLAAVGRLASSIAHEINNPLESVTNLIYLARKDAVTEEMRDYLETAERELRRVAVITNQTLRFHKQATKPRLVSCEELFESVLSIHQGRVVNAHVRIERRSRGNASVMCFDGEIRQVLNNLAGNAIDAMHPGGGRLLLRSRPGTEWSTGRRGVVLTVADSGEGISPAVMKRVFEPFFTTKGDSGTGLGLWVSQEIIARHEGGLRVRSSQREGLSGTVFTVFLPAEAAKR
ncbi:MAG TPA: PAS domain-containing protein [Granulicella sp.]|nr:PAS domain-containing protein [Granulicella sp.]